MLECHSNITFMQECFPPYISPFTEKGSFFHSMTHLCGRWLWRHHDSSLTEPIISLPQILLWREVASSEESKAILLDQSIARSFCLERSSSDHWNCEETCREYEIVQCWTVEGVNSKIKLGYFRTVWSLSLIHKETKSTQILLYICGIPQNSLGNARVAPP